MRNRLRPIHPGEILPEEILVPLEMSAHAPSQRFASPPTRVNDIVLPAGAALPRTQRCGCAVVRQLA
jgi:plasmid maintenance system antidote protein VapI